MTDNHMQIVAAFDRALTPEEHAAFAGPLPLDPEILARVEAAAHLQWCYAVDDEGRVYVGGRDPESAARRAREDGNHGPVVFGMEETR